MLAKQTLNHPGSQQWKDEPGETLSLTSLTMTLHSLSSPSNVGSSKRWRRSIHTKSPALLFKHPMPTCASWLVKWWCLRWDTQSLALSCLGVCDYSSG